MQLTDPVAEAAMDLGDDSEGSASELDDAVLDQIQAAEEAVTSDPGNYEAHIAVCSSSIHLTVAVTVLRRPPTVHRVCSI